MHDVKDHYLNYLNLVNVVILCTSNYIDHDTPGNVELLITCYLWVTYVYMHSIIKYIHTILYILNTETEMM